MAPVIHAAWRRRESLLTMVCATAQHREMLDQVLDVFAIVPDHDLNIMRDGQSLNDLTIRALQGLQKVIENERPDLVLVQGDTASTFAGSLAAYYARVPVAHVEAGLRTYDKYHPFPEEINRKLTTQIADLHFAPTEQAKRNLLKDGIEEKRIFVTGNTVIDALFMMKSRFDSPQLRGRLDTYFREKLGISIDGGRRKILVTGHRRENFGQGLENIAEALKMIAVSYNDVDVIFPVHLNPNVREPVRRALGGVRNIYLIDPLEYEPFIYLMTQSYLILTDSGGIQEEAPSLGKPVLVMRETTERPEAVEAGTARLVGTDVNTILTETGRLLDDMGLYHDMSQRRNPYGDGRASERIIRTIDGDKVSASSGS